MTKKNSHFCINIHMIWSPLEFCGNNFFFSSSQFLPFASFNCFFFFHLHVQCTVHSPNHNVFHRHSHYGIVLVEFIVACNVDLFVSEWDKVWAMRPASAYVLPRIFSLGIEQNAKFNWNSRQADSMKNET